MTHRGPARPIGPGIPPSRISLRIDSLVLDGMRPGDRFRIGDAFERELARLLAARIPDPLLHGEIVPVLDAGQIALETGLTPDSIGERIARAVYAGFDAAPEHSHGGARPEVIRPKTV